MFLGMCSIPSFSAAFVLCFCLPESPKFLLSKGRNKEALEVCKAIFQVNTGKPKSEYPVSFQALFFAFIIKSINLGQLSL